ncbi:hypothetical protein HYS48_04695, partial [Candidatus Woesearchaeota archaeon]|nr:hypothetical protein [Candidatus Woesearchaeota archaeon]
AVTGNEAGWRNERHGLKLELTGIDSITKDDTNVRDTEGNPAKWRKYENDEKAILSFFGFNGTTRLEEQAAGKKAIAYFYENCNATGNFQVDPGLVLETASTQINITSNATPAWKAVYDMNFGGVLYTFLVPSSDSPNTPDRNIVAQTPTSAGMDQVSGIGVGEGTGGPMPFYQISDGTANYAVLENSSARMRIKITADLITFTTSDVGDVVEVLTFYPWKIVYDRNITLTSLSDMQTRSFASYFILNRTLDNVTLINNITITFIPDINETGDVPLPTNFSKIHGQMITANNTIINVLFNQIKQDMFQDDYVNMENAFTLIRAHGFSEGTTDIATGNYRMITVLDMNNDNTSNATAQLRFKDYQKPDSLTFIRGNRVIEFGDDDSDGFTEREGSYAMNILKAAVVFNITNSSAITRYKPAFKVYNYSFNELPQVWVTNSSGTFNITRLLEHNAVYLNDTAANNITIVQYFDDIEENTKIKICYDCLHPSVREILPAANTVYVQYVKVNISANVTDDRGVSTVNGTITYPNGSKTTFPMILASGNIYNLTFNDTVQLGRYNVTINASDSYDNLNDTETTYFNITDVIPPNITNLIENPVDSPTYTPNGFYLFNATIIDNVAVDKAWVDWNGTNYSQTDGFIGNVSSNYFFNRTPLAAGIYAYRWYANDTSNNANRTEEQSYTVNKAAGEVNLTLNNTRGNITIEVGSTIPLNLSKITGDTAPSGELFRQGVKINFGALPLSNLTTENVLGLINITGRQNESQNYTEDTETWFIRVVDTQKPNVTNMQPANGTTLRHSMDTNISINVTVLDNIGISIVYANVTFPNGTFSNFNSMTDPNADNVYNFTITDVSQLGKYIVRFFANDTSNNINDTESIFFYVNDSNPPYFVEETEFPADPATYAPGQFYQFNVTCKDNTQCDKVQLNFSGKRNDSTNISNIYVVNMTDLAAGNYSYNWTGNDTSNNRNTSEQFNYTVNKAITTLDLTINPSNQTVYPDQTTATCTANNNQVTITLYRNGTTVANPETKLFAAGSYNYTCIAAESQNYTSARAQNILNIAKNSSAEVMLQLNQSRSNVTIAVGKEILLNTSSVKGDSNPNGKLYRDGTLINAGALPLWNLSTFNDLGTFNITAEQDASENYTKDSETWFVRTIDIMPPSVTNISPIPNSSFPKNTIINISTNVTDNIAIDKVFANVTFPNASTILFRLFNASAHNFTGLLNDTSQLGKYNLTIVANDTSGNINDTEKSNLSVLDNFPPIITNLTESPNDPTNFSIGKTYQFNATVIDADNNVDKVRVWFNGTFYNASNISSAYSINLSGLSAGFYQYYWIANDTIGNQNQTENQNYTVNKAISEIHLQLNGTEDNITVEVHSTIDAVGTLLNGIGRMELFREGVVMIMDDSPITNDTNFGSLGTFQIRVRYNETGNFTGSNAT